MWRVEYHDCGWSSRWLVVKGYLGNGFTLFNEGYTNEADAIKVANKLNND